MLNATRFKTKNLHFIVLSSQNCCVTRFTTILSALKKKDDVTGGFQEEHYKIHDSARGNDQALITFTGFDHQTFQWLLDLFKPLCNTRSPHKDSRKLYRLKQRGRRRLHNAADILGLYLTWTRTRGSTMVLSVVFAMTASNVQRYLYFARRILLRVLVNHPAAAICIPSAEKIREYQAAIEDRHPLLENVWWAFDGLQLEIECDGDFETQRRFFNSWKASHFVKALLVFCPDGTIPIAVFNVPGCVHDSKVATIGGVYDKLEEIYNELGAIAVGDSAFCASKGDFVIRSSKKDAQGYQTPTNKEATSLRQASEWGMRGLQASFPRLKDVIKLEDFGERGYIMHVMLLLHNVRARKVGINQIRNTYMLF